MVSTLVPDDQPDRLTIDNSIISRIKLAANRVMYYCFEWSMEFINENQ